MFTSVYLDYLVNWLTTSNKNLCTPYIGPQVVAYINSESPIILGDEQRAIILPADDQPAPPSSRLRETCSKRPSSSETTSKPFLLLGGDQQALPTPRRRSASPSSSETISKPFPLLGDDQQAFPPPHAA